MALVVSGHATHMHWFVACHVHTLMQALVTFWGDATCPTLYWKGTKINRRHLPKVLITKQLKHPDTSGVPIAMRPIGMHEKYLGIHDKSYVTWWRSERLFWVMLLKANVVSNFRSASILLRHCELSLDCSVRLERVAGVLLCSVLNIPAICSTASAKTG
jgi:hypothetical protein